MTVPPETIQVKAQIAKAMRNAAVEHCGWTPSLKLCMVLYEAAAPLIAAAERDRLRQPIAQAITDPGTVTPRNSASGVWETRLEWQARAIRLLLQDPP